MRTVNKINMKLKIMETKTKQKNQTKRGKEIDWFLAKEKYYNMLYWCIFETFRDAKRRSLLGRNVKSDMELVRDNIKELRRELKNLDFFVEQDILENE